MPSITDTDSIIAAFLLAVCAHRAIAWAFKTFLLTGRSGPGLLRRRDRRLGVVDGISRCAPQAHPHPPRHRGASDHDRWSGGRADRDRNRGAEAARAPARGRDHRERRRLVQRPTSAKTCNRRKLPIRLCQMTKFVLDRDTPATVVSLVAKASLR